MTQRSRIPAALYRRTATLRTVCEPPFSTNFRDCLGNVAAMFASRSLTSKYSAILALTLAIFSAGFVVVHACHSDQLTQSTAIGSFEFTDKTASAVTGKSSFAANICTAIFFLALLAIRKFVMKKNTKFIEQAKLQVLRLRSVTQRPPNSLSALSIFQLGVIRI